MVEHLRTITPRGEIILEEVPAPQKLAAYSFAFTADISAQPHINSAESDEVASGRFVILHEPGGQDTWEGTFRCVTFVRSALDIEMESDPLLPDVGWSWFIDALKNSNAEYVSPSGTVTRVMSASYGQLSPQDQSSEIEVRASWTPIEPKHLIHHVNAWLELMASAAGLPPLPEGVTSLPARR